MWISEYARLNFCLHALSACHTCTQVNKQIHTNIHTCIYVKNNCIHAYVHTHVPNQDIIIHTCARKPVSLHAHKHTHTKTKLYTHSPDNYMCMCAVAGRSGSKVSSHSKSLSNFRFSLWPCTPFTRGGFFIFNCCAFAFAILLVLQVSFIGVL